MMIEINLLPQDLCKRKKKFDINIPAVSKKSLFKVFAGIFCLVIIIHILLTCVLVIKNIRLARLKKDWEQIGPMREQIDILKNDMSFLEDKVRAIAQLTTETKVIWSEKWNIISNVIPNGVWLRRISVSKERLDIEGSAVSKKGEEMMLVGKLANNLKKTDRFYYDFKDIEVSSIKRRKVGAIEIADFAITAYIKRDMP